MTQEGYTASHCLHFYREGRIVPVHHIKVQKVDASKSFLCQFPFLTSTCRYIGLFPRPSAKDSHTALSILPSSHRPFACSTTATSERVACCSFGCACTYRPLYHLDVGTQSSSLFTLDDHTVPRRPITGTMDPVKRTPPVSSKVRRGFASNI